MKKKTIKKLQLHTETVREITREELARANGAGNTVWCTEQCSLHNC